MIPPKQKHSLLLTFIHSTNSFSAIIMSTRFAWLLGLAGLFTLSSCAHMWKGTPDSISGVINHYASVVDLQDCSDIEVDNASRFSEGDLILIAQMQGAVIDGTNFSSYGQISSYGSAGLYEYGRIKWISGNHMWLEAQLVNTYDVAGRVQIVFVPEYKNVKVTGPLTCAPWNGYTGGILAMKASGNIILGADINVDGKGFRGGVIREQTTIIPTYQTDYIGADFEKYGRKGEGIAGFGVGVMTLGRGAPANGGGGGGNHNAGGGGGSNGGCGGNGGYSYQHSRYSGNYRNAQGLGARSLSVQPARLFLGGGGGAGHSNNMTAHDGGDGGGLIIIQAKSIVGKGHQISARGDGSAVSKYDGGSGGGAGGTVALHIQAVNGDLVIDVSGGDGGDSYNDVEYQNVGTGGGGGGGVIKATAWSSGSGSVAAIVTGGENGLTIRNDAYGAKPGCDGIISHALVLPHGTDSCLPPEDFEAEDESAIEITQAGTSADRTTSSAH